MLATRTSEKVTFDQILKEYRMQALQVSWGRLNQAEGAGTEALRHMTTYDM